MYGFIQTHVSCKSKLQPYLVHGKDRKFFVRLFCKCTPDVPEDKSHCVSYLQFGKLVNSMTVATWDTPDRVRESRLFRALLHMMLVQLGGRSSGIGTADFREDIFDISDESWLSMAIKLADRQASSDDFHYSIGPDTIDIHLEFFVTVDHIKEAREFLGKALDDYIVLFAIRRMSFFRRAWKAPADAVVGRCPARLLDDDLGMIVARFLLEKLRAEKKMVASVDAADSPGAHKAFARVADIL